MPQRRLFYAIHAVAFAPNGSTSYTAAHGVQSVGMTTTFNLEQVFELGQIAIYENIENIPDIECTMEKVLDGYPLLWHLATQGSTTATLAGRSGQKVAVALSVFGDVQDSSSGTPIGQVTMSGLAVSSLSYTFPVEGNFTESVTLVGNDRVWTTTGFTFTGGFVNTDQPVSIGGSGGVNRREDLLFKYTGTSLDANNHLSDSNATILPRDVAGVTTSGTLTIDSEGGRSSKLQNISVSCDLGREELFELGRKSPYARFVTFPVEVSTEIEIIALSGDFVSATEAGVAGGGNNLADRTIKIATREGTRIDLGLKNKLSSVGYTGGDADGGNVSVTYSYTTFNDFTVVHWNDPTTSLRVAQNTPSGA